jgi:hypothetical protein
MVALILTVLLAAVGTLQSSDIPAIHGHLIGHPRARFPLAVYAQWPGNVAFDSSERRAVAEWNTVFKQAFGLRAFTWTNQQDNADVIIIFRERGQLGHSMGETELDADQRGVIRLPVKITLVQVSSRGSTTASQVFFDIVAHELGHALGLPHINKPSSIMCCDPGAINFADPAARASYLAGRHHPDLRSVIPELQERYHRFWEKMKFA